MNRTKIQFSSGHKEGMGEEGDRFYHNINNPGPEVIGSAPVLAPDELALVKDGGLILTKNAIIGKVIALFSGLAEQMSVRWGSVDWPDSLAGWVPGIVKTGPKISKGENYQGLPWVVLDHPRVFTKEDVFAIRTLFWWGNYFSVTLHLKGICKERWISVIRGNLSLLAEEGFHICISDDEWRHELAGDNYLSLAQATPGDVELVFQKTSFLKLSAMVRLEQWNDAPAQLLRLFDILLKALGSLPGYSLPNHSLPD